MLIKTRPQSTREKILKTAGRLFYEVGYRAIGIERIITEADVARQSFYNHFPSKDHVMLAWIEIASSYGEQGEIQAIQGRSDALTAIVESIVKRAREESCRGCTFQVGAIEFPNPDHPVHLAALAVKRRTLERYRTYAESEGALSPDRAAQQVFIIVEGIWAAVRLYGSEAPIDGVVAMAKLAIRA
jgi:AcrR family transcriptional regulator